MQSKSGVRFSSCGLSAVLMDFAKDEFCLDTQRRLWSACGAKGAFQRVKGLRSLVLGVNNVLVHFSPQHTNRAMLEEQLLLAWQNAEPSQKAGRLVEVPVVYQTGEEFDLAAIAQRSGLSIEEVVQRHAAPDYDVACVGAVPGFTYLVGLDSALAMPRRAVPRTEVPAGAVGIGGSQTGIMPMRMASGWNLLGLAEVELFVPDRSPPCLVGPGDRIRFKVRAIQ